MVCCIIKKYCSLCWGTFKLIKVPLIVIMVLFSNELFGQKEDGINLLNYSMEKHSNIYSAQVLFKIKVKTKLAFDLKTKDTLPAYGSLMLFFNKYDTLFDKVSYVLDIEGNNKYIYIDDTCFALSIKDSSIKKQYCKNNPFWVFGVHLLSLVKTFAAQPERIGKIASIASDSMYHVSIIKDTVVSDKETLKLRVERNDILAGYDSLSTPSYIKDLYITKDDSLLIKEFHFKVENGFPFYWDEEIISCQINYLDYNEIRQKALTALDSFAGIGYKEKEPVYKKSNTYIPPPPKVILKKGIILPNWKLPLYAKEVDSVELYSINAQYILLDFWYASCAPCLQDIPKIKSYANTYHREELSIYGINVYDHDTSRIGAIDSKFHFNYPILINGRELAEKDYGQNAFPLKVLLDSEKKIIYIGKGHSLKEGPTELDLLLKKLLGH